MIFCIDPHVFIWAIKKQASEHDEDRLNQAEEFLKWVDEGEHILMVPTVVLAECLSQEPIEKQSAIMKITYETCVVLDFNATAALKYAQVLNLEKFQTAKAKAKTEGIAREQMKIDYLIVCCAMANGVQRIYSHDPDIYKFADGLIDVQELPKVKKKLQQPSLFSPETIAQIALESKTVQEKDLSVSIEKIAVDIGLEDTKDDVTEIEESDEEITEIIEEDLLEKDTNNKQISKSAEEENVKTPMGKAENKEDKAQEKND